MWPWGQVCSLFRFKFLWYPEICQFCVSVLEQKHVFWFKVGVDISFGMQLLQTEDDASDQKSYPVLSCFLEKFMFFTIFIYQLVTISSWGILHCEIVIFYIIRCSINFRDEWGVTYPEYLLLDNEPIDLLLFNELLFIYPFYGNHYLFLVVLNIFKKS